MSRNTLLLKLMVVTLCSCKAGMKQGGVDASQRITVEVTYTSSYCGGARPPEDLERELATPKPLESEKLFFRKGDQNDLNQPIVATCVSDENGKCVVELVPGKYSVVTSLKADSLQFLAFSRDYASETPSWSAIDKGCLRSWLNTPELLIDVTKSQPSVFTLNVHRPCFWSSVPCANYKGPFPP